MTVRAPSTALSVALFFFALAAEAKTVTYSVAIGNNAPPSRTTEQLPTLRFADDDAVRYDAFFARLGATHFLLSVLDAQTQRRYPSATDTARPPSLAALRSVVSELAARMQADHARGDRVVFFLSYSGHGAQGSDGGVFLSLTDGELTRKVLYDEVFAALPADFVHLFVDACHAEAVVGARGLFSKEREATVAPLGREERARVIEQRLDRFPHVGALMAATEDQESHEWSTLQSGIFTHELLSALTGAGDVNGDGLVEYSEAQAFVVSANRDVKDPRAAPHVVSSPPAVNPRAPLVSLSQLSDVAFLEDDLSSLGHFHVELDDGERYLDANFSEELRGRIAVPARRRAFIIAGAREAELTAAPGAVQRVAELRFRERSLGSRGAIEASQRAALFQSPFGPTYYRGFADSTGGVAVPFVDARAASAGQIRSVPAIVAWVLGGGALVASGITGLMALEQKRLFDATELQRPASDAATRFGLYGNASWIAASSAAVFAVAGALLWVLAPDAANAVSLSPVVTSTSGGFVLGGAF